MKRPNGKWVLVTGASTGIGRQCALHLQELGYSVIAGVRQPVDADAIRTQRITPIELDVTRADDIQTLGSRIEELAGDGLCGIVNNAGVAVFGPVEFVSLPDWRRQFEINLFGQIAVTQQALPSLRRHIAARGAGAARIIFISSIAGKVSQPILSPYCASKFALEAIADALRFELAAQTIHTVLIEPGAVQSEIWRKGDQGEKAISADHPAREMYGPWINAIAKRARESAASAISARQVSAAVVKALTQPHPRARYVIGRSAKIASILKRILSDRQWDAVIRKEIMK